MISLIISCSLLFGFIGLIIEENIRNKKEDNNIRNKPNIPIP